MKILKDIYVTLSNIFSKQFYFLASLASFVSLFVVFFNDKYAILIALCFFCLMLFVFTSALIYALFRIINISNIDYESKSTFIKYETLDANFITYEIYKTIQSKKAIITEFPYNFKWTGSIMPKISSDLQQLDLVFDNNDSSKYDYALLKFKKPLYFNQNEVIHVKAVLDDTDKKSQTYISTRITQEIDIIHYRVILKYKPVDYQVNALLLKRKINAIDAEFELQKEIHFDNTSKSYELHLLKPDIGYIYKLSWKR